MSALGIQPFQFILVKPVSSKRKRNLRVGVVEWITALRVLGRRPENDDSNLIDGERQGSQINAVRDTRAGDPAYSNMIGFPRQLLP